MRQEKLLIGVVIESHPLRLRNRAGAKAFPMDFPITDLHPANVLEEEERNRALKPFLKVFP